MDWDETSKMTRFHSRLWRALGTAGLVKWQILICMIIGFVYVHFGSSLDSNGISTGSILVSNSVPIVETLIPNATVAASARSIGGETWATLVKHLQDPIRITAC